MKKRKQISLIQRWQKLSIDAKVWLSVLLVALFVGSLYGWAQVQDARNATFLRQITADFTQLEVDLEQELGMDVTNSSSCFTTSEKFNEGVTACFMRLEADEIPDVSLASDTLLSLINALRSFSPANEFRDDSYESTYSGWDCTFGKWPLEKNTVYIECPVPVRAANRDLVRALVGM